MADGINVPTCAYIRFLAFGRQPVIADFSGGQISCDGGALLPRTMLSTPQELLGQNI